MAHFEAGRGRLLNMSTSTATHRKLRYGNLRLIAAGASTTACAIFAVAWIFSALDNRPVDINWLIQSQPSHGLRIEQTSSGYVLMIPHWLPLAITGVLTVALVPSIMIALSSRLLATISRMLGAMRRTQIPRRFSLRSMLIVTTLTACLLGIVAAVVR
jgi:hypothetical protein